MMACRCSQSALLNGLMGAMLASGSRIRVGFAYEVGATGNWEMEQYFENPENVRATLTTALLYTGEFESVTVTVTGPRYGGLVDGYILVGAVTSVDKGDPEDVGSLIEGVLYQVLPELLINRRDPVVIESVPVRQPGSPPIARPNTDQYPSGAPRGSGNSGSGNNQSSPSGSGLFDRIGIDLGLGSSSAIYLLVGGAVLITVLIAKR